MTSKHVLRSRALVPIALLAAFLLAGEASLRACAFRYLPRAEREVVWNRSRDASLLDAHGLYERDPREMWRLRAGATIAADETVNALGMRGEVFARGRTAGTVRHSGLS